MRNAWLIVRRELSAYARTPSGWIIAACILLIDGLMFNAVAVGPEPRLSSNVLRFFLLNAAGTKILAAVLFSMRLLAEERANGTQVLLFTSPIREGEIVVGKFLASLVFLTILTLLTLYLPALIFINGKVSVGHIAAGYLGMFLLGAAALAIGVFASSLARGPFIAIVLTAVFVGLLELCRWIAQVTDPPFAPVIEFLAPHFSHFRPSFAKGLIRLNDIVFFLSVVYFSLLAATRVLQSQRWQ